MTVGPDPSAPLWAAPPATPSHAAPPNPTPRNVPEDHNRKNNSEVDYWSARQAAILFEQEQRRAKARGGTSGGPSPVAPLGVSAAPASATLSLRSLERAPAASRSSRGEPEPVPTIELDDTLSSSPTSVTVLEEVSVPSAPRASSRPLLAPSPPGDSRGKLQLPSQALRMQPGTNYGKPLHVNPPSASLALSAQNLSLVSSGGGVGSVGMGLINLHGSTLPSSTPHPLTPSHDSTPGSQDSLPKSVDELRAQLPDHLKRFAGQFMPHSGAPAGSWQREYSNACRVQTEGQRRAREEIMSHIASRRGGGLGVPGLGGFSSPAGIGPVKGAKPAGGGGSIPYQKGGGGGRASWRDM